MTASNLFSLGLASSVLEGLGFLYMVSPAFSGAPWLFVLLLAMAICGVIASVSRRSQEGYIPRDVLLPSALPFVVIVLGAFIPFLMGMVAGGGG